MNHERWLQTLWSQIILISWPNTVWWLGTVGVGHAWFPVRSIHRFLLLLFFPLRSYSSSAVFYSWSSPSSSTSHQKLLLPVFVAYDVVYKHRAVPFMGVCCGCWWRYRCVCVVWNSSGQGLCRGPLTATLHLPNGIIIPVRWLNYRHRLSAVSFFAPRLLNITDQSVMTVELG